MKRTTIYVDEKVWLGIRKHCLEIDKSVGEYLVGLHLGKETPKQEKVKSENQEIKKPPITSKKEEPKDMSLEERREWAYKQMKKGRG